MNTNQCPITLEVSRNDFECIRSTLTLHDTKRGCGRGLRYATGEYRIDGVKASGCQRRRIRERHMDSMRRSREPVCGLSRDVSMWYGLNATARCDSCPCFSCGDDSLVPHASFLPQIVLGARTQMENHLGRGDSGRLICIHLMIWKRHVGIKAVSILGLSYRRSRNISRNRVLCRKNIRIQFDDVRFQLNSMIPGEYGSRLAVVTEACIHTVPGPQ